MTKLHKFGEEVPEGFLNRVNLSPDLAFYLARFWELSSCRGASFGSSPARITYGEIDRCYNRAVADVTDFDTFFYWIRFIDSEFGEYMTPVKDREENIERMRQINRENAKD